MNRGRSIARYAALAQVALLAAALAGPGSVAAATLGFTLSNPSVATVAYSDLVIFRGTYTCLNDVAGTCPTTINTHTATFALAPTGETTFTNVATVTTGFTFTANPAGCVATCSAAFQVVWRAGRAGSTTIPPGVYDVRLTTTISSGAPILVAGLTIVPEGTQTTLGGATSGLGGTALALSASVVDLDRGLSPGTGIITPDVNLGGAGLVTFELYDATNTTLIVGPVAANLSSGGATTGSPSLQLPTAGGSFRLRTTFAGNGFYTTSADLDTISVTPSNTPPELVGPASPIVAEATSGAGAAVTFEVAATDAEDDPDPDPDCDWSPGDTFPLGDTTVTCTVTDGGGLSDSASFVVRVVDTTDPTLGIGTAESAAESGWHNIASNDGTPGLTIDVSTSDLVGVVTLSCTNNGVDVGPLESTGDSFVVTDGSHAIACIAADAAGNVAGATVSFSVDQTAPTISAAVAPAAAETGWWNLASGAPTVSFTCSDAGSGLTACSDAVTLGEGADQSVTGSATDAAGNPSTAGASDLDVDLTAPSGVAFIGSGLADGATSWFGLVPDAPTVCTASDAGAGLASCEVTGYSAVVGAHVMTALATDGAGNAASATLSYQVLPWTLAGFAKPVEMSGFNSIKAGGSVPLKFDVLAGATPVDPALVGATLEQQRVSCTTEAVIGAASPKHVARGNKGHHNQPGGGGLQARWEAPEEPGTCWLVTLQTADGSSLSAAFRLR